MFLLFFKMCTLTNLFTLLQLSYRFVLLLLCITLKRICVECFSHNRVINQRYITEPVHKVSRNSTNLHDISTKRLKFTKLVINALSAVHSLSLIHI